MVANHLRMYIIYEYAKADVFVSLDECCSVWCMIWTILVITHRVQAMSKFIFKLKYIYCIGEFLGLVYPFAKDSTSGILLGVFHPL